MNSEQHKMRTEQLVRSLHKAKALIIRRTDAADWPAYRGGDRRTRPLFWVNRADVEQLIADGVLFVTEKGVDLGTETRRRLTYGHSAREIIESREFVPSGVQRPVRRNVRGSVILRLSRRRDKSGAPLLSDAQLTAAHQYARDYHRAGGNGRAGSSSFAAKVDHAQRHDAVESAILSHLDGHERLSKARKAIGPKLTKLLDGVCGANERLEAIERAETWSAGMGLHSLQIALDLLASHYGTVPGVSSSDRGQDDYRRRA
ncbi:MAG: DUF6456 domain-containing protein [Pseudomonadota bacterium]